LDSNQHPAVNRSAAGGPLGYGSGFGPRFRTLRYDSIRSGRYQVRYGRRTIEFGRRTLEALQEQWQASHYRSDGSLVFGHPALGTPLDPSKLSRSYVKPALAKAKIVKPFRPFHGLRHTAITHEAAVNPQAYVQMRAGHSQGSITERYIHAVQAAFPGAAQRGENRIFAALDGV
jgi:integrase